MLFLARGRVSLPSMRSRQLSEKRPLISHIHNFFHCGSKISFSSCDTFKSWCVINILGITITLTAWLGIVTIQLSCVQSHMLSSQFNVLFRLPQVFFSLNYIRALKILAMRLPNAILRFFLKA